MPVDRLIETRKENGAEDDVVGGQQKQSPEEGIPEGGPIPLHRDTTIYVYIIRRIRHGIQTRRHRLSIGM